MAILTDSQLKEAMSRGELRIDPPPIHIQPASIDLTLGGEAFVASADELTKLSDGKLLILPAGELALVITREELKLSPKIVGHIGLRSGFTRKGLVLLAGPQIDAGFEGTLHIALCNLSPTEVALSFGEPFCTVEFHELTVPVEKPYRGEHQGQKGITSKEIADIRQRRGYALSEVIKNMQSIASDISSMKNDISSLKEAVTTLTTRTDRYMMIFVTSIGVLVASLVALLINTLV